MMRLGTFLTEEVPWSRVLGIALLAAFVSFAVPAEMRSFFVVLAFPVGAILVAQAAVKHPFWNALLYGIFGIIFWEVLYFLVILGETKQVMTWEELAGTAMYMALIIPQALLGAWVAITFRRAQEASGRRAAEGEKKAAEERGQGEEKSRKKEAGSSPAPQGRQEGAAKPGANGQRRQGKADQAEARPSPHPQGRKGRRTGPKV